MVKEDLLGSLTRTLVSKLNKRQAMHICIDLELPFHQKETVDELRSRISELLPKPAVNPMTAYLKMGCAELGTAAEALGIPNVGLCKERYSV